jgi:NAD(P)-dependent dehydrogenase (short-subunit alcohol dehydrogenase family)
MIDLSGRRIVVTGACGILGRHFTEHLAGLGADVIALDLPAAVADVSFNPAKGSVRSFGIDLADSGSIREVAARVVEECGTPDGLLNNAASKGSDTLAFMRDALTITPETWREVTSVNLDGTFLLTQQFGAHMVAAKSGAIVFIGSIYGEMGPDPRIYEGSSYLGTEITTPPVYAATKAALSGLTRYLAAYWGEHDVRVNCVCPGGVESGQNEVFQQKYSNRVPLRRMARPEDIVGPVAFLLSDAAAYITGQTLMVDGGLSAW